MLHAPDPLMPRLADWLSSADLRALLEVARREDLGDGGVGDVTSLVSIPADAVGPGCFVARRAGVLCGGAVLGAVGDVLGSSGVPLMIQPERVDGERVERGDRIARISGSLRDVLAVERTALNLMTHLSGIATLTRQYVDAVIGAASPTPPAIYDTRKTLPGLRALQKYAVACGGGRNHRMGLHDAVLIKDNHLAHLAPGDLERGLQLAIAAAGKLDPRPRFFEVEVDTLEQLEVALRVTGIDVVLLDNMSLEELRQAVAMRDKALGRGGGVELEASGGVTLATVAAIAATGVDRIAVGELTHSAPALDIGLDFDGCGSGLVRC